ncbi:hypothetical protein MYP_3962 [Sporocytophaga myxococcoides]|uniref:Uncharacterized protein n=1 Tax=Sporocytophaga myxococcoides TaxID=153721 RepID=A0A098LKB1_9BACT|nr:hypothetical protein [Sporocytophaga myxococcoides]GAL86732.1 hypothetical protein MYP_3962 [Sporocytophaga myxococcoides]
MTKDFSNFSFPPAQYSVFIEEKGKLYASNDDGTGSLSPFTISTGINEIYPLCCLLS